MEFFGEVGDSDELFRVGSETEETIIINAGDGVSFRFVWTRDGP